MLMSLILSLVLVQTSESDGRKTADIRTRIASLNSEMLRLDVHMQRLSSKSRSLAEEIEELELGRAIIASKIEKTQLQIELTDRELEKIEAEKLVLEERIEDQKARLMLRLRSVYKRGKFGYSQIFLKQTQLKDLINAYHYSRFLTEKDHEAFNAFRQNLNQLQTMMQTLEQTRIEAQNLQHEFSLQKTEQDQLLRKRNATLSRINQQASEKRRLMEDVKLEKEELEYVLEGLLTGEPEPLKRLLPIIRYKGRLDWPAMGNVLREFGVIRDPEFKTVRKQNGIDIDLPAGTPVKAVFAGRVIYADWFKSYGNLVIVDHGDQVATFYAHNAHLDVIRGQMVAKDEKIGTSGDTGSLTGPFLHFEIRTKGKPDNPRKWLKPRKK